MTEQTMQKNGDHFQLSADALLALLDARSKDIIIRRYGIVSDSTETLDSIGKEYGITRERVRQIESQAKKLLARRDEVLVDVAASLETLFDTHGGALAEDHLMDVAQKEMSDAPRLALVRFFLDVLTPYSYVSRSKVFAPHWVHPGLLTEHAERVVTTTEDILKESGEPVPQDKLLSALRTRAELDESQISDEVLLALLKAGKDLKPTVFEEWGLGDWVETSPRGVSDKAYIVLKRNRKPLHFREITEYINRVAFDHKRAHEQTVHNELIKDDRFVLVGRGLYGLTDWGYIPGTVADVLEAVLVEAERPLTREELLEKVLEQRMVKKTTILLGLQNSDRFTKVEGDRYELSKAA